MIEELKYLIDACEGNPKLKKIFLDVANLPENKQAETLRLIKIIAGITPDD